jgi:hypothetical protein
MEAVLLEVVVKAEAVEVLLEAVDLEVVAENFENTQHNCNRKADQFHHLHLKGMGRTVFHYLQNLPKYMNTKQFRLQVCL